MSAMHGNTQYRDGWERLDAMDPPPGGMTQQQIADVVGCTRANIFMLEKRALLKCARALAAQGLGPEDLLRGEGQ